MDGATPHSIPLVHEKDNLKVVTKCDDSDTVVTAGLGKVCSHVCFCFCFCFFGNLFHVNHQTVVGTLVLLFNQESGILKGHCHGDFAVLGQFCGEIITLKLYS